MPSVLSPADSAYGLLRPGKPGFSVCFPSPLAIGASASPDTAYETASLVAQSAAEEGIPLLLTPAPNRFSSASDARRGLCFGDDPELNVRLCAAWIRGLQENGVGAVLRILPVDPAETDDAPERVLAEVRPCAVLSGRPVGTDLPCLPDRKPEADSEALREALRRAAPLLRKPEEFDWGMQHHQARKMARQATVLLKNADGLLPVRGNRRIAMIGAAAECPVFRAPGLPEIRCTETLSALQAVRSVSPVTYAPGYPAESSETDQSLIKDAVRIAEASDLALVFAATRDGRPDLPAAQTALIEAVAAVQPRTAVILHAQGPVDLPWLDRVAALMLVFPSGQAGGAADIDLLFGAVPIRGRLPIVLPGTPFPMGAGILPPS